MWEAWGSFSWGPATRHAGCGQGNDAGWLWRASARLRLGSSCLLILRAVSEGVGGPSGPGRGVWACVWVQTTLTDGCKVGE